MCNTHNMSEINHLDRSFIYIYIFVYIYREWEKERERPLHVCICMNIWKLYVYTYSIYIYIHSDSAVAFAIALFPSLPEAAYWLLLTGEVPTDPQVTALQKELHDRSTLPQSVTTLIDSLSKETTGNKQQATGSRQYAMGITYIYRFICIYGWS